MIYNVPIKRPWLLIGARALATRPTKDIDILTYSDCLIGDWNIDPKILAASDGKYDVLLADNHPTLQSLLRDRLDGRISIYQVLFILKAGHIHLPRKNWFNDIQDYHVLGKILQNGTRDRMYEEAMAKQYRKELDKFAKPFVPSLKVSKQEFFDDGVKKYIDHDALHEIFAHHDEPLYKKMLSEGEEVHCDVELWNSFSVVHKIEAVLEETYVIMTERFIIPAIIRGNVDKLNIRNVFFESLKKVCTTLSSGWFQRFAINNYFAIVYASDYDNVGNEFINNYKNKIK